MKYIEKRELTLISIVLIFILLINLVSAQTIVKKEEAQEQQKQSFFSSFWSTLTSPLFLGILVFIIIGLIIIGIIFFILIKIIKYIKLRTDLFYKLKIERIKNCKGLSRYINSKYWWHIDKNTPLRLVKKNEEGELTISKPFAYYRGDYLSHEGNVVLAVNFPNRKKWWIFPVIDLLIIPNKKKITITQTIKEGKSEKVELANIPNAKELIKFLDGEILVFAESISNTKDFFFPVVKSESGKVIDLAMPIYQSLKDVVLEEYLYTQTTEFVDIARKSMDINPNLRYAQKLGDQNQAVEIPEQRRI